jgi:hypothetical protein
MKKKYAISLLILICLIIPKSAISQMSHMDSIKAHNASVKHRNDSIRKAHDKVIDSVLVSGKYYPVTSTDLYDHDERIKENDLLGCESDTICKTIRVNRKEAEKVKVEFPTNKLSGKLFMYKGYTFNHELYDGDFPTGDDYIDLTFANIDDGVYKFKFERSDRTYIFKLVIKTVKYW